MLRLMLSTLGVKGIETVAAFTNSLQKRLPPYDTLNAIMRTESGISGTFSLSVGTEAKNGTEIEIVTDRGRVLMRPIEVLCVTKNEAGEMVEKAEKVVMSFGVKEEIALWAESIGGAKLDDRISAPEALEDLRLLEAMLKSAGEGGELKPVS
jgi:predicted dehydrogenase